MGLIKLFVFGFLGLSVVYLSLSVYSRSIRREKLEERWDDERPDGISREDYVSKGIVDYNGSLRPKLLLLIYVVPTLVVGAIVYITNAN